MPQVATDVAARRSSSDGGGTAETAWKAQEAGVSEMAIAAMSDLFAALGRSEFDAVFGTPESDWLDFKAQPYRSRENDEKLELVKDVSALANGTGGVIVVGYKTTREQSTARDIATEHSLVPHALVDVDSYRQLVESRTYPPIRNLRFRWWPTTGDKGILTIEVPAARDSDRPVLTVGLTEPGSRRELLLGIFQRTGDQARALLAAEVHAQLRLGRLWQEGGPTVGTARLRRPMGPSPNERARRLQADTVDGGLEGRRRYYLQAWPSSRTEVQGLHAPGLEGLRNLLSLPPEIRGAGFGLRSGVQPAVIPGGGLRLLTDRHVLSLEPNGLLTWVASVSL